MRSTVLRLCLLFTAALVVGGASVAARADQTALAYCENDVCVWGMFCENRPASNKGCDVENAFPQFCDTYLCGQQ